MRSPSSLRLPSPTAMTSLLRLLLGRVGDDYPAANLLALFDALDDHAVVKWFDVGSHKAPLLLNLDEFGFDCFRARLWRSLAGIATRPGAIRPVSPRKIIRF